MTTATAIALVNSFATSSPSGVWTGISAATLAADLKANLGNADYVNQAGTPFCGASSFLRALILDQPDAYAQAAVDLFKSGSATVGTLKMEAGADARTSGPQSGTSAADWLMLTSIMDAANLWFSAGGWWSRGSVAPGGMTPPGTLAGFFTAAGFSTVINNAGVTALPAPVGRVLMAAANVYKAAGHHVVMLLDDDVMHKSNQDDMVSLWPTHWVTLTTPITCAASMAWSDPVSMKVFSWGAIHDIPEYATSPLEMENFLNKFYGYIAVKK